MTDSIYITIFEHEIRTLRDMCEEALSTEQPMIEIKADEFYGTGSIEVERRDADGNRRIETL